MISQPSGRRIAIIGAGFSGSLLALHLLRGAAPEDRIYLVEKHRQFGRGPAYATGNPNHLLNVRAGNMSAFPDQPDHFVAWLAALPATLATLRPAMVLLLGLGAARVVLDSREPLGRLRAGVHRLGDGTPAVVSYDPAYLLRAPDAKAAAWADLCRALAVVRAQAS